jgi:hypothetical protein
MRWGDDIHQEHMIKKEQFWIHGGLRGKSGSRLRYTYLEDVAIPPLFRSFEAKPLAEDSSEFDQSGVIPSAAEGYDRRTSRQPQGAIKT